MTKTKRTVPDGWFKWERLDFDFPFYNDESVPLWHAWLLIASALAMAVGINTLHLEGPYTSQMFIFLVTFIPFMFVAHNDLATIVKTPRWGDIPLVILVVILDYLYTFIMTIIMQLVFHMQLNANAVMGDTMDATFFALVFVQLFGEELFKLNLFFGVLMLMFRKTNKRRMSIVVATVACLVIFAVAHMGAYGSLLQILLVQGLGGIFMMFAYLKTKNVLPAYAAHLIIDFIPFTLAATGTLDKLRDMAEALQALM